VAVIAATSVAAGGSWWVKVARRDRAAVATLTPSRVEAITLKESPDVARRMVETEPALPEAGLAPAPRAIVEAPPAPRTPPEPREPRVVADAGSLLVDAALRVSDAAISEPPREPEAPADVGESEPEFELD
jgi:hypothetical protein